MDRKFSAMRIEHLQVVILWLGIIVIVAMCLYPPWVCTLNERSPNSPTRQLLLPGEYGFIWGAPERVQNSSNGVEKTISATVDVCRLTIQCIIVLLICVPLSLSLGYQSPFFSDKSKKSQ
jgi:hypothetical protein